MDNRPIGVFDSGLGGLTSVKELASLLPGEDLVYFGDTARIPYGGRSADTIIRYGKEDIDFLLQNGVKAILCACGTVSSTLPQTLTDALPVPYVGVVAASSAAAVAASRSGNIGLIATAASVRSGSYERHIAALAPQAKVTSNACPLLVPLIENGYVRRGDPITTAFVREYLAPILAAGVDTLILGCTHYPIIADTIADVAGSDVSLVNSGSEGAKALCSLLRENDLLCGKPTGGSIDLYISDSGENFAEIGGLFLGKDVHGTVHPFTVWD